MFRTQEEMGAEMTLKMAKEREEAKK